MKIESVLNVCFIVFLPVIVKDVYSIEDCNFCVWENCIPTIVGIEEKIFDPKTDVKTIKESFGMFGIVQKHRIFDLFMHRSEKQKQVILSMYYEQEEKELSSQFSFSDMDNLLKLMTVPLPKMYMEFLEDALEAQNLERIVEIFTILPNCAIKLIQKQYLNKNQKSLNDDLNSQLKHTYPEDTVIDVLYLMASGNRKTKKKSMKSFIKEIMTMITSSIHKRPDKKELSIQISKTNKDHALEKDVETLKKVIRRDKWNEKHKTFREIFVSRTLPEVRKIVEKYESEEGSLENYFDNKAQLQSAAIIYVTILKIVKDQPKYFADKLHVILNTKHMGNVNREDLNYILLGRSSIDLGNIKSSYYDHYRQDLYEEMRSKTTRIGYDYYQAIYKLVKDKILQ